jgi:uncharacterized protein YkwD
VYPDNLGGGPCGPPNPLARLLCAAQALAILGCAAVRHPPDRTRATPSPLRIRAPDLSQPLVESLPAADGYPNDVVKEGIFERINRDRLLAGLPPVAWDEAASRVADAFCAQQVREATRGHFLMDGVPPYARTAFAGVFGAQSENSVSWVTTAASFNEPLLRLALKGHEEMMDEKPPQDGHRRTILDPDVTHVGVGYANANGRFQMSQEFLTRGLERLKLVALESPRLAMRFEGKMLQTWQLEFVTIAREPSPAPLTQEEATGRTSYSYPRPTIAYVPEGTSLIRVSETDTQARIRLRSSKEFSFSFAPDRPGLYTFVFYTAARASEPARPGASATIWVEGD